MKLDSLLTTPCWFVLGIGGTGGGKTVSGSNLGGNAGGGEGCGNPLSIDDKLSVRASTNVLVDSNSSIVCSIV